MLRRPPTLVEDYTHIPIVDPAWDTEHLDFTDSYNRGLETGMWDQVPVKPGQLPTIWTLRHLRGIAKRRLSDHLLIAHREGLSGAAIATACQMAVVAVENFLDDKGQGYTLSTHVDPASRIECLTDECLEYLDEVPGLVNDIGLRAIRMLTLPKS